MKSHILIIEILAILLLSFIATSGIVAILCLVCKVPFTVGKAIVIWIISFAMNVIRRKINERNA